MGGLWWEEKNEKAYALHQLEPGLGFYKYLRQVQKNMERTHFKYARQTGGKGFYAEVTISLTRGYAWTVKDNCDSKELPWRAAAIQGMNFALGNVLLHSSYQFALEVIEGHLAHSSENAFFIAGASAVFKSLQISLNEDDNALLLNYINTGSISRFNNLYEVP
jgi:hypothetical protein